MAQLITAVFSDHATGQAAADALMQQGFTADSVRLVTRLVSPKGRAKSPEAAEDAFVAALTKDGIAKAEATRFAEAVKAGSAFLSVQAPFGRAEPAKRTVQGFHPTELGGHILGGDEGPGTEITPLSAALGLPVLSHNVAPFSKFWGMPLLSNDYSISKIFGWKLLSDSITPVSRQFGWKLLSEKTASISRQFNWPLLSENTTPLSKKFNWPLLTSRKFFFIE